ncbi:MFS transporter [Wolbachia pipientis]|uniref:MFS transporter n=1 Tax=Wolbachia pipientis TaxID=955 RepID=A0A1E7QJ75_WOLPI|nr:MFS transporter [Wolbachia pipientis]OEY86532.1 MFS transporter [Wolbachia pipientis]
MVTVQTKVLIASILCRTTIWYDHTLFIELVNIMSREFCYAENTYYGILQFFGITWLGTMARPLGAAFVLGHIGDRYGRKVALLIAMLFISIPSSLIAFIPNYNQIGIAATMLFLTIQIIQGIALGGEQGGSSVYLMEHLSYKQQKLGMFLGITGLGRSIGMLLSTVIIIICKKTTDFNAWGWRIPFIFLVVLGLLSAYSIYLLGETPAYKANNERSAFPIMDLIKHHKRILILAILIAMPINIIAGFIIFLRTLAKEIVSIEMYAATYVNEIINIITGILIPICSIAFGMLADKVGKERTAILFIIVTMMLCCPILSIAYYCKNYLIIMLSIMVLTILERGINPIGIVISELFPTQFRFSGVSVSRNISYLIYGGSAPMICTFFIKNFPQINFLAGIYVTLNLLIGLIAILQVRPQDKQSYW